MRPTYYALVVVAIVALGYSAAAWWTGRQYRKSEERIFKQKLDLRNRAAIPRPPEAGDLLARLEIPRIHISVVVVEGDQAANLEHDVGHIPGTELPGERGNVAFAAHRDTYFRPLAAIDAGDSIGVATLQGTYRYQVVSTKIVRPSDVSVFYPDWARHSDPGNVLSIPLRRCCAHAIHCAGGATPLRSFAYPKRGIAFSVQAGKGKSLYVVMTFASHWFTFES